MAKDDDEDDGLPPLGDKTDVALEEAKKAKPRNFLIICKGGKIRYLVAQKKRIKAVAVTTAKKLGYKGDAYFGLITKEGADLCFNLLIPEDDNSVNEQSPGPVIDSRLKGFLEEHVGLKVKATFKWVRDLPLPPFEDEDLADPLVGRFVKMAEQVSKVFDVNAAATAELAKATSEIRKLLDDDESRTAAEQKMDVLNARLNELLNVGQVAEQSDSASVPSTSKTIEQSVDPNALKSKLQEALNKLVPQLKQAVTLFPERKVELLTPVATIKKQLESDELQDARQGILAVGQLLKSVLAQVPKQTDISPSGNQQPDLSDEYETKLASIQPEYNKALREMLGDTSKFRAVMAYVLALAETSEFSKAILALNRLEEALGKALSVAASTSGQVSNVQLQQSLLLWDQARLKIQYDLDDLELEILNLFRDDKRLGFIQDNIHKLDAVLGGYAMELRDRLDDAYNAVSEERPRLQGIALEVVNSYRTYLDTAPFIKAVALNRIKPIDIEGVLGKTLDVVASKLSA